MPYSTRLTWPLMISPMRSLNTSYCLSRSASRIFCTSTCLEAWAGSAEVERRQRFGDPVADLRRGVLLLRFGEGDLGRVVLDQVDHQQQPREADFPGLGVDLGAHLGLLTVARARRLLHRVLHRGEHDRAVDRLFARDGVDDLQELEFVGADGHRFLLQSGLRRRWAAAGPQKPFSFACRALRARVALRRAERRPSPPRRNAPPWSVSSPPSRASARRGSGRR